MGASCECEAKAAEASSEAPHSCAAMQELTAGRSELQQAAGARLVLGRMMEG